MSTLTVTSCRISMMSAKVPDDFAELIKDKIGIQPLTQNLKTSSILIY